MEAYDKGLREIGRKILIENNITPNKTIDIACTPISFEPISARIDKNNEVILIGYSYQDRTNYKVICNVNKHIYGKSNINAVIYRIIIDRNKTPRIMCFTDKSTYVYRNVEDIKKI